MAAQRVILVTGATGRQGGAVLRHLQNTDFTLRAMTRKPEGEVATALRTRGVEVVKGDLDDESSLKAALTGAWGVFAVQNTWEAGVEGEEAQGKRLALMAKAAGVQHYVYTSVGSAGRKTGIPHFENKWRVAGTVRGQRGPSHAIFRPVFFMENLPTPWFLNGDTLATAMKPTTGLQMIAVDDIGRVGARAFTNVEPLNRREIEIAGDTVTMTRAAEVLGSALGRRIEFMQIPIDQVRKKSEDFALMLEWFEKVGYNADVPALEREFGRMTRLEEWAARTLKR